QLQGGDGWAARPGDLRRWLGGGVARAAGGDAADRRAVAFPATGGGVLAARLGVLRCRRDPLPRLPRGRLGRFVQRAARPVAPIPDGSGEGADRALAARLSTAGDARAGA